MSAAADRAGTILVVGAGVLLAGWLVHGLVAEADPGAASTSAPAPAAAAATDADRVAAVAAARSVPATTESAPAAASASFASGAAPGAAAATVRPTEPGYAALLDRVFAPDRAVAVAAARPGAPTAAATPGSLPTADPRAVAPAAGPTAMAVRDTAPEAAKPAPAPATEKSYYEDFLASAKEDAAALPRQADAVLHGDGPDCQKVALLRALFESDQAAATAWFLRAITTLPDHATAAGVSVPAFAVDWLCRRTGDPAVRGVMEQMAWAGGMNVGDGLRQVAADALLAVASEADLRRYAAYPGFVPLTVVTEVR